MRNAVLFREFFRGRSIDQFPTAGLVMAVAGNGADRTAGYAGSATPVMVVEAIGMMI
jgi:hypothetical protein